MSIFIQIRADNGETVDSMSFTSSIAGTLKYLRIVANHAASLRDNDRHTQGYRWIELHTPLQEAIRYDIWNQTFEARLSNGTWTATP